ncbi:RraA family protein [Agrococcus casei]|uniref:RraA family protein n=1 Tax=Agrococcus casei TaxID=343512 RepID=UPI003F9146DC
MSLADAEIRERLLGVAVSQIGDSMDRLGVVDAAIRPVWPNEPFAGRAATVVTAGGDNQAIHDAIPLLEDGQVLVINGQGVTHRALIGELMAERAQRKGCRAYVIDGAVRDVDDIAALGFPVYARAVTPAGPYRNGPGRLGIPVAVGGVVVEPGDWVVGDRDGVCVVRASEIEQVLEAAEAKRAKEEQQKVDIRAGLVD